MDGWASWGTRRILGRGKGGRLWALVLLQATVGGIAQGSAGNSNQPELPRKAAHPSVMLSQHRPKQQWISGKSDWHRKFTISAHRFSFKLNNCQLFYLPSGFLTEEFIFCLLHCPFSLHGCQRVMMFYKNLETETRM